MRLQPWKGTRGAEMSEESIREEFKVGEVAARTGLTVRTLHHYDEIDLLTPGRRTASGHRLYGKPELRRLQQISSLRQAGFSLKEIRDLLDRRGISAGEVVALHLDRLKERIRKEQRLCRHLEAVFRSPTGARVAEVSSEELLSTIEEIIMLEKYYTEEQLEQLRQRRESLGEEAIHEAEQEWPRLIAAVRAEMDKGTDPRSETVQALARCWRELIEAFTGGDDGIRASLANMYKTNPHAAEAKGFSPDSEMMGYLGRAMKG